MAAGGRAAGRRARRPPFPERSPAQPRRGCAAPTWPARRSRWRSGCRRWRTKFSGFLGGSNGLTVTPPIPPASLGATFPLERWQAWIACLAALATYVLLANLVRSGYGRAFRAVRDDEVAAQLAGFHVARTQITAFVVSAACAGLAGGLLVVVTSLVAPGAFPLTLSVALLTGVILGGTGSLARRRLGRGRAGARPHLGRRRQQGAVAVGQRPGQPRAGHLRRRAHRRDAGRPRRHPGGAARPGRLLHGFWEPRSRGPAPRAKEEERS